MFSGDKYAYQLLKQHNLFCLFIYINIWLLGGGIKLYNDDIIIA